VSRTLLRSRDSGKWGVLFCSVLFVDGVLLRAVTSLQPVGVLPQEKAKHKRGNKHAQTYKTSIIAAVARGSARFRSRSGLRLFRR